MFNNGRPNFQYPFYSRPDYYGQQAASQAYLHPSMMRPGVHPSQYPMQHSKMLQEQQREKQSWISRQTITTRILLGLAVFGVICLIVIPLGLIPVYLNAGKGQVGTFRLRVDNALRLSNADLNAILQKPEFSKTAEESQKVKNFTDRLESQLNEKLKPSFGSDVKDISRVTLVPSSDGQILVNFDVNTREIAKTSATAVKTNIQSALSKSNIIDTFSSGATSSDFKNPSIGAFVVNDPQDQNEVIASVAIQLDPPATNNNTTTATSIATSTATITTTASTITTTATLESPTTQSTTTTASTTTTSTTESTIPEATTPETTTTTTASTTATSTTPRPRPPPNPANNRPPPPPPNNRPNLPPPPFNPPPIGPSDGLEIVAV